MTGSETSSLSTQKRAKFVESKVSIGNINEGSKVTEDVGRD